MKSDSNILSESLENRSILKSDIINLGVEHDKNETEKKFTKEQKDWAIDEFIAESLSVDQIAEQLHCKTQCIYR